MHEELCASRNNSAQEQLHAPQQFHSRHAKCGSLSLRVEQIKQLHDKMSAFNEFHLSSFRSIPIWTTLALKIQFYVQFSFNPNKIHQNKLIKIFRITRPTLS